MKIFIKKQLIGIAFGLLLSSQSAYSAEKVALINGAFKKTILVSDIEYLAKTGKAKGYLSDVLKITKQDPKAISEFLNKKIELKLVVTSKLMNSKIGEALLGRISKVIHPVKVPKESVSVPAIRAGIINGIILTEGGINLMNFIKGYPNKVMAIDLPALSKLVQKAESINELIKFFSNSPLEALKEPKL